MANFLGFVTEGLEVDYDQPVQYRQHLMRLVGDEVLVSIKRRPKFQGTQSMRYYRGVVVPDIAVACGYTDPDDYESCHDALAWKFLRLADHPQLGTPRRRSTAKDDLTQDEMTSYIDKCIAWAETSIPGCTVRRPDDVDMDRVPDETWE